MLSRTGSDRVSADVAVIGANGYIGKHLCQALTNNSTEVMRLSAGSQSGISLTSGLFPKDFTLPPGLKTVYYLAQSPYYRQTPEQSAHLFSVNCIASVQAAEAARRAGVKRFIYASTGNVYTPSFLPISEAAPVRRDNWYALSKVMAEDALALYRPYLDITIARLFGVYGPGQTDKLVPMIADKIQNSQPIYLDRNLQNPADFDGLSISLIYIDDLVRSLLSLMHVNDCEFMNLAGIEAVSMRRLTTELAQCMGLSFNIEMNQAERSFNLIADTSLQTQRLGYPLVSLSEGIQRFCHARK